jgi:hypothetical protein
MPLKLHQSMIILCNCMEYSNVFHYLRLQGCKRIFIYILNFEVEKWVGRWGGGGALYYNYVELKCS